MPPAFQGSSFLLTYPQSDFPLIDYIEHVKQLDSFKYVRVCSEQHADGSFHRHAVVYFSRKIRVGQRYFDFKERHPNIKTVGRTKEDWKRSIAYVSKDEEFLEYGSPRHDEDSSVWASVLAASSREEALKLIQTEKPRDFILQRRNIDYALDQVCSCLTHFYK